MYFLSSRARRPRTRTRRVALRSFRHRSVECGTLFPVLFALHFFALHFFATTTSLCVTQDM